MSSIALVAGIVTRRESVPTARIAMLARDHFTCCYRGRRTIPSIVLRCFGAIWPREFP
jgi:hypothetical protein